MTILLIIYFLINIILTIHTVKKTNKKINIGYIIGVITILLFGLLIIIIGMIVSLFQMKSKNKIKNYNDIIDRLQDMNYDKDNLTNEQWHLGYIYAKNQAVNIIKDIKKENEVNE